MSQPWEGAMIPMLRVLINDNPLQGSYAYSDPRLIEILVVSSMYVCQEVQSLTSYNVDVVFNTITPDPYTVGDKIFLNMAVMKAACIIDHGQYRCKALMSGLEAKCGPATLKTTNYLTGFKDLLELGPCGIYEKLKEEQKFSGQALNNLIHFILSPFTGNDFDPVCALRTYYETERMVR